MNARTISSCIGMVVVCSAIGVALRSTMVDATTAAFAAIIPALLGLFLAMREERLPGVVGVAASTALVGLCAHYDAPLVVLTPVTLLILTGAYFVAHRTRDELVAYVTTAGAIGVAVVAGFNPLFGAVLGLGVVALCARRSRDGAWTGFAIAAVGLQMLLLGIGHPMIGGTTLHGWALVACVVAAQLHLMDVRPVGSYLIAAVLLGAVSTEIGVLTNWSFGLTLLWLATAAGVWTLGRDRAALRHIAIACVAAAALKLVALDWMQIAVAMRVALMLVIGGALTVLPLTLKTQNVAR